MTGQPGVESVTKQFLYQSAYRSFVLDHGFDHVVNAFLVPSEGNEPRLLATVTFPGVVAKEASPFGNCIGMVALPAHDLFDCFLRDMPADEQVMQQLLLILKQ